MDQSNLEDFEGIITKYDVKIKEVSNGFLLLHEGEYLVFSDLDVMLAKIKALLELGEEEGGDEEPKEGDDEASIQPVDDEVIIIK